MTVIQLRVLGESSADEGKSSADDVKSSAEWRKKIEDANPDNGGKYAAVFDAATGLETQQDSYSHLPLRGRLIVYGFHSIPPYPWTCPHSHRCSQRVFARQSFCRDQR
jgi:hypothetical protein